MRPKQQTTNKQTTNYVIDSHDKERIDETAEVLNKMLKSEDLLGLVLLVFANKQDLDDIMSLSEIFQRLGLDEMGLRSCNIQPCSAVSGQGLREGLEMIAEMLFVSSVK